MLLSLGLVGGAISACGGKDQGKTQIPDIGCGNAPACAPGCGPPPAGVVCGDAGPEYDASQSTDAHATADAQDAESTTDARDEGFSFGCGNAPACAPGCPPPNGWTCTDAGPVYDASTSD